MVTRRPQTGASKVVSLRVSADQAKRLLRKARQLGRTPSETGAMLGMNSHALGVRHDLILGEG
ncbi:MAG: hypothetical protein HYZ27_05860, partial [Deltaproteobacteria bacterium]|nr:hypothetical protein [Deltaproteobacteria bacterium]